jgi:CheY-like chemotaxis protein
VTRVLIVDDDVEQARSLSRMFGKLRPDLTVLTASSGAAATQLMREQSVDLLLTELQMPQMDGFELLGWVNEHFPETAVFAMSKDKTNGRQQELNVLGVSDRFAKPVDPQAVVTRLCEDINHSVRGVVHNVSLASFLQLLEMERKSCTLLVNCSDRDGALVIDKGVLVGALAGELQGQAAAIAIVAWPSPSIVISRRSVPTGTPIKSSLGFILIEAMRIQDENALRAEKAEGSASVWPKPRRTWRPTQAPPQDGVTFESSRPPNGELGLPSGASGFALVETATGNVLRAAARDDCPIGELARLASQLLLQEAATLRLCNDLEGIEELVLSTTSRCDVIRPLNEGQFALLVFAPEETNLVIARIELDHFIAVQQARGADS